MKIESTAFIDNGMIPFLYTCDGQDISPELSWDAPPAGTQSLALIVDDPDAPDQTFVHWVLYQNVLEAESLRA
jgi:Raf kinase inhibitor-like YbhB/YbcL family protein